MKENIRRIDLEPILAAHQGNRVFARTLERMVNGDDLLRVLGRYIHFNSTFGAGVANLAGEIAARQDLFRDPDELVEIIADRSVEVAADIFFAAVDEFDDRATAYRDTHRTLAQATLKAAGRFFGKDPATLNDITRLNESTRAALGQVRDGYGIDQAVDAGKLFRAMGFHIGSEILADEEFNILDRFLRARHGDLVNYLEKTEVELNDFRHAAYYWIRVHTSVEADHFDAAVVGANRSLRYYAGPESPARLKSWILEGLREFSGVQTNFMTHLLTE